MSRSVSPKIIPIVEASKEATVSLYEAQIKVYPHSVTGLYTRWRWLMVWLTQLFFYGMPWIQWGQRQALLFDVDVKRFYIFNLVLYPQDLIYLAALLIVSALTLFLFTAVAGRLWCGYTCPQTVYTEMFLWIEAKVEGDRVARLKLDAAPMSLRKFSKKLGKHALWIALALWTGFTFVGYFTPIREMSANLLTLSMGPWDTFWVFFYGFATYGNAGFLREQVCKYMCPYARFQGAMFDEDTLMVTYDEARGEPRGRRSHKLDSSSLGLGSCVDCTLCVQVCPTGIDIRDGLQLECINCGVCIDACDTVMDKMGYEPGLIKYSTPNGIANGWSVKQMFKRVLRPRVLIYSAVLIALCVGLLVSLNSKADFRLDVIRDRGVMARIVQGGMLENVYRVQILNATETVRRYRLSAVGLEGLHVRSSVQDRDHSILVQPADARWVSVRLRIPDASASPGSHKIKFVLEALDNHETVTEKAAFLVPR